MHGQSSSSGHRLFTLYASAPVHEKGSRTNGDQTRAFHNDLLGSRLDLSAQGLEGWHTRSNGAEGTSSRDSKV